MSQRQHLHNTGKPNLEQIHRNCRLERSNDTVHIPACWSHPERIHTVHRYYPSPTGALFLWAVVTTLVPDGSICIDQPPAKS